MCITVSYETGHIDIDIEINWCHIMKKYYCPRLWGKLASLVYPIKMNDTLVNWDIMGLIGKTNHQAQTLSLIPHIHTNN